jgi:hypothetical protein
MSNKGTGSEKCKVVPPSKKTITSAVVGLSMTFKDFPTMCISVISISQSTLATLSAQVTQSRGNAKSFLQQVAGVHTMRLTANSSAECTCVFGNNVLFAISSKLCADSASIR